MGVAGGGQAATWPGSRAHTHLFWPGRSFFRAAMQPLQSWTLPMAGLAVEAAGMAERVNQMALHFFFLIRCFWSLWSSFPHPEMGGNRGNRPESPTRRGKRVPSSSRGPPVCHRPAPPPTVRRRGPPEGAVAYC